MKKTLLLAMSISLIIASCNKKEPTSTQVSEININKTELTLKVGASELLIMSFKPQNAELKTILWESSDTSVVTVTDGLVYAKSEGTSTVTVSTENKKATCEVTVMTDYIEVTKITLNIDTIGLYLGDSVNLEASMQPENTTLTTPIWTSSDNSVVTVNHSGLVVAKSLGKAIITAKADNTEAICRVSVIQENISSKIYVAGHNMDNSEVPTAMFWEDGEATVVNDGDIFYSVFASGNDVYFGGYGNENGKQTARIWKNGIATTLTDGTRNAWVHSVYVDGDDVYAAGNTTNDNGKLVATVWKNNQATQISEGIREAYGNSVFVSGEDVYVAGWEKNPASKWVAKLWVNGNETILSEETKNEFAYSVHVCESDVYVAGYGINESSIAVAKLWKNNEPIDLTDGTNHAYANYVYVSNGDVYVVGEELNSSYKVIAKLWKNGEAVDLSDGTNGTWATSVFVSDGDVYVCGYQSVGTNYESLFWKNGEVMQLPCEQKGSKAYSVFVK